jgi:hypothetical protein
MDKDTRDARRAILIPAGMKGNVVTGNIDSFIHPDEGANSACG